MSDYRNTSIGTPDHSGSAEKIGEPPPGLSASQRQAWRKKQRYTYSHHMDEPVLYLVTITLFESSSLQQLHHTASLAPVPVVLCAVRTMLTRIVLVGSGLCVNNLRAHHWQLRPISHQLMPPGNEPS